MTCAEGSGHALCRFFFFYNMVRKAPSRTTKTRHLTEWLIPNGIRRTSFLLLRIYKFVRGRTWIVQKLSKADQIPISFILYSFLLITLSLISTRLYGTLCLRYHHSVCVCVCVCVWAHGRTCLYPLANIAYIQYKRNNRMMTEKTALAIYISKLSLLSYLIKHAEANAMFYVVVIFAVFSSLFFWGLGIWHTTCLWILTHFKPQYIKHLHALNEKVK